MTIRLLPGDCRTVLATLPADSVHCVVTSPPYYGLRDYGVDRQIGLEATPDAYLAEMVAVFREVRRVLRPDGTVWCNLGDSFSSGGNGPGSGKQLTNVGANLPPKRTEGLAPKQLLMMPARLALALQADGWWLRSDIIWHKPNPMPESVTDRPTSAHEHVFLLAKAARYFYDADAVREENSETGQPWGNKRNTDAKTDASLGDAKSLNGAGLDPGRYWGSGRNCRNVWTIATAPLSSAFSGGSYRIASRDCVAHDRQADLAHVLECDARQDVFQFGRNPGKRSRPAELPEGAVVSIPVDRSAFPAGVTSAIGHSNQTHRTPSLSERDVIFADIPSGHTECRALLDHSFAMSARTPASNTSPGASPDAPLWCVRAGTSERGCCAACGAPWGRQTERSVAFTSGSGRSGNVPNGKHGGTVQALSGEYDIRMGPSVATTTTGWAPSCACAADTVPCTVLDPFAGAGTTLLVADRLQRDAIGIELNPAYTEMAMDRCRDDAPLFASPPPAEPPEDARIRDLFAEPLAAE